MTITYSATNAEHQAMMVRAPQFVKRANAVHMLQLGVEFDVETAEGTMHGHPGDWLVFDTLSGHLWVVADEYKDMHYITLEEAQSGGTGTSGAGQASDAGA